MIDRIAPAAAFGGGVTFDDLLIVSQYFGTMLLTANIGAARDCVFDELAL